MLNLRNYLLENEEVTNFNEFLEILTTYILDLRILEDRIFFDDLNKVNNFEEFTEVLRNYDYEVFEDFGGVIDFFEMIVMDHASYIPELMRDFFLENFNFEKFVKKAFEFDDLHLLKVNLFNHKAVLMLRG